jgi:3-oxoacyl-[acyl-carrier protein] reductase
MDLALSGRAVLIAGSTAGIGLATARAFAGEGAAVLLTGRDRRRLAAARDSISQETKGAVVETFEGDMTDPAVIDGCVRHAQAALGGLDVMVANVGTGRTARGWDADATAWTSSLHQNLLGAVALVRVGVPVMTSGGAIVLIGSIAGVEAMPAPLAYCTAKSALHAYGKGLAGELAPKGIRVNTVAPGNIRFPGGRWEELERADPEGTARYIRAEVPLQRFGRAEEIASVVVFLASPAASFMTGACVVVDGGQTHSL